MVRTIYRYPFHPAMKAVLEMLGLRCGVCRLPLPRLSADEAADLLRRLESIGFFDWAR